MFDEDEDQKLLAFAIGLVGVVVLLVVGFVITLAIANDPANAGDSEVAAVDGLQAEVEAALAGVDGVTVAVAGGVVTLTGEVADEAARSAAVDAAAAVEGVDEVHDELTLAAEPEATDEEATDEPTDDEDADGESDALTAAVEAALADDGIDGVSVTADGGVVTLTGEVADEDTRDLALAAAEGTEGVLEVVDQLTIAGDAPAGDGTALAEMTFTGAGDQVLVAGGIADEDARANVLDAARAAFGADVTVVDGLTLDDSVALADGTLVASGAFDSEDLQAAFVADVTTVADGLGAGVEDRTTVVAGADTLEALNDLFADGGVQFESSQATLTEESIAVLDEAVELLADAPDLVVAVTGYTDSSGNAAANQQLSEDRAQAVADYLVENGVAAAQIGEVVGRGSENPVASNDTPAGRAQNRRIEFSTSRA